MSGSSSLPAPFIPQPIDYSTGLNNLNKLRETQAQQAIGANYQKAIGPDGTFNPLMFNQLNAATPDAAYGMKSAVESGQQVASSQASQQGTQLDNVNKNSTMLNRATAALMVDASDANLKTQLDTLLAQGADPQRVEAARKILQPMSEAQRKNYGYQLNLQNHDAVHQVYGAPPTMQDFGDSKRPVSTLAGAPGRPPSAQVGAGTPLELSPGQKTDMVDVIMSDKTTRQVARGDLAEFIKNNPGATTAFLGGRQPSTTAGGAGATAPQAPPAEALKASGGIVPVTSPSGVKVNVAQDAAEDYAGFLKEMEDRGYKLDQSQTGGYNNRNIAGTNTPSQHAYGHAIDLNWNNNPRGASGKSDLPADVGEIAARHNLTWGGNWKGDTRDPMHFEWRGRPQVATAAAAPVAPGAFTSPTPQQQDTATLNTRAYNEDQARQPALNTRLQNMAHAYDALQEMKVATGQGAAGISRLRSTLQTLGVLPPGAVADQKVVEEFNKYTTRLMTDAAGGGATDLGRHMSEQSSPGSALSTQANFELLRNDMGKAVQEMAAYKAHDPKTNGAGYLEHRANIADVTDPRGFVWNMYTPQEQAEILAKVKDDPVADKKLHKAIGMSERYKLQVPLTQQAAPPTPGKQSMLVPQGQNALMPAAPGQNPLMMTG